MWLAAMVGDGACSKNPEVTINVNYKSVKNLLNNFSNKIIFMSTCSVYGQSNKILNELSKKNPLSLYASSKIDAEKLLNKSSNESCIFRLGTLYGTGDQISRIRLDLVVNILTMKAALNKPLEVFGGDQWRPLLHVKDVSNAILYAIENNITGTFNISDKNYKIKDLAFQIANHFKKKVDIKVSKIMFEDTRNYKVDSSKFKKLGWLPKYKLDDGINEIKLLIKENIASTWFF